MFAAATIAILVALALAVLRAIRGPTVFDRVLAGNSVGTLAILLLAAVGFTGRPEWLDIGITYGLLNIISTCSSAPLRSPSAWTSVVRIGVPAEHRQHDEEADDIADGDVPTVAYPEPDRPRLRVHVGDGDAGR